MLDSLYYTMTGTLLHVMKHRSQGLSSSLALTLGTRLVMTSP